MAVFFIAAGAHSTLPITLGWVANNVSGHYKRAVSTAIQISLGNCAGFIGSNVFVNSQAPAYKMGYGVSLGCICMTVVTATMFVLGLRAENRKRDSGAERLEAESATGRGQEPRGWSPNCSLCLLDRALCFCGVNLKIYFQVAKLGLHKSRISRSASKAYHENRTILSGSIFEGINVTGATEQWELQEQ